MCTVGGWKWSEAGDEMFCVTIMKTNSLWDCATVLAPDIKNFFLSDRFLHKGHHILKVFFPLWAYTAETGHGVITLSSFSY